MYLRRCLEGKKKKKNKIITIKNSKTKQKVYTVIQKDPAS